MQKGDDRSMHIYSIKLISDWTSCYISFLVSDVNAAILKVSSLCWQCYNYSILLLSESLTLMS